LLGAIPVPPEADVADGLLDIVLIAERGPAELAILAAQILLGKHLSSDGIIFRRAKKIVISSRPGMWFNVDGELIGMNRHFRVAAASIAMRSRSSVNRKIITLDELREKSERLRSAGKRVVATNGCFDILHVGHVLTWRRRETRHVLVVGANGDIRSVSSKAKAGPSTANRIGRRCWPRSSRSILRDDFFRITGHEFLRRAQPAIYPRRRLYRDTLDPKNARFGEIRNQD